MGRETVSIAGRLLIDVRDPDGRLIGRRLGTNTVLSGGRQLLARMLAGQAQGPAFEVAVGTGSAATTPDMAALSEAAQLQPVAVETADTLANQVALQATFPLAAAAETIAEAGLLVTCATDTVTGPVLYNRVLIDPPLPLTAGQQLVTSWQLSFSSHVEGEA